MTDILARLRSETCSEHEAVERQLGLVDETLTLAQYRRRLEQFWGFYAPLEARLEAGAGTGPGAPILDAALGTFRSLRTWCDESAVAP